MFASLNIWFGTWAIYIPTIKEKLDIDKADLGIALFFLSFGVFVVFPVAPKVINWLGVGRATWFGVLLCSVFALVPLASTHYAVLCLGLFLFGVSNGITDISMNTLVTEIEKKDRQNLMSATHGFFSLGGVLAGLGSFFIPSIGNPLWHMSIVVALVFFVNFLLKDHYLPIRSAPMENESFNIRLFRPLMVLGLICFISMASEGAIVDWSGLYLKEITLSDEAFIGMGFLAFSIAMTLGRFLGDGFSQRLGSINILALGTIVAIMGYFCVLSAHTLGAIFGFLLNGLGFSVIVPELFRIGGKIKGVDSSQGVAFIAGSGYSGFLLGPVALGYLAEEFTLKTSFWVLLASVFMVLLLVFVLKRR